jgi:hypothetical protein
MEGRTRMAKVTVRRGWLSRSSSIGMILLGFITFLFVSALIGIILMVIGGVMYWFYRRQTAAASLAGGEPQVGTGAPG